VENQKAKYNLQELLSPNIINNPSKFLEILEYTDSIVPTRESALIIKKAMAVQKDPVLSFLLKKSFRLAAFKLKGAAFKISLTGLDKLLRSPDRLDDLALAVTSVEKAEAFMASDFFKSANWKYFPTEILPCFCYFYKKHGNSQDLDDLLELTRHPNPTVIAAALEALKKLDTGSLRSIIQPLIQKQSENKESAALENLYVANANYDSSNISNESKEYYKENHQLIIDTLQNGTSDLETVRILRLIKKYGNEQDVNYVKPFLIKDKPDIVRAAIKVLEKFDPEYLCIYLPQLLQDKNPKVRLTATRAFQSIDSESVINMVLSLLKSLNVKQRTIGITTAMLVDFNMVRDAYLQAFSKETSEDLLEKIGLVLAANPDRELVKDLYFAHKSSKTLLKAQREKIIELVSEKVSFSLGGNPWPKELILEAKNLYETAQKEGVSPSPTDETKDSNNTTAENVKPSGFYRNTKANTPPINNGKPKDLYATASEIKIEPIQEKSGWSTLNSKAKITIIFLCFGAIFWGILIVAVVMKVFF
jgi:HEAT repeat protein